MKRKTTTLLSQRRIALNKGKKPAKHVRNEGEDGGAAQAASPVHFLVCLRCGTLGAAVNVTLTNAAAIRRCIRRSLAEARPNGRVPEGVRTNSTEGNTQGTQLSLEALLKKLEGED